MKYLVKQMQTANSLQLQSSSKVAELEVLLKIKVEQLISVTPVC